MKLISWNVNGMRSIHKKGALLPLVETYQPDVLCLQETRALQHQSEFDVREHYQEYWNAAERKGYSGTAVFSKKQPLSVSLDFPLPLMKSYPCVEQLAVHKEGRVLTAEFEQFFVVNVYTPNAKEDLSRLALRHTCWDPAFLAYCKALEKKKPVIMCGDFNVAHTPLDLSNPKANMHSHGFTQEERAGIDALIEAGFVDTFRLFTKEGGHYTWWSHWSNARARNIGWRIDYFFVSKKLAKQVKKAEILFQVEGSDHCPVLLEI